MSTTPQPLDPRIGLFARHFAIGVVSAKNAWIYIRDNRLWHGFWKYGWVSNFLMLSGLFVSLQFMDIFESWSDKTESQSFFQSMVNTGTLFKDLAIGGYEMFNNGWAKYLILVLMEVFIFHVVRRTFEMISGNEMDSSFDAFLEAQIRMAKIMFKCWILEIILTFAIGLALSLFGGDYFKPIFVFLIQSYFLGFAVIDNYHEMFEMSIKESEEATQKIPGLAFSIGIIVYILMLVPVAGSVLGPLIGAVAATLALFNMNPPIQISTDGLAVTD